MTTKPNVYEMVTEQIVAQLEQGTVAWRKPWRSGVGVGPTNLVSNKAYRGINVFLLAVQPYASPYWLTFNQMTTLGGNLKKINGADEKGTGQKSTLVVFWQMLRVRDGEDQKLIPMLRYYRVFNLDQTENVHIPKGRVTDEKNEEVEFDAITAAEAIVAGYQNPPKISENQPAAWYRADIDLINLPKRELFETPDEFYTTLFHELGHSTGEKNRLDRLAPTYFGSHEYGREELVAEMTAAFLSAEAGIESTQDNSAAYLASWITTIREDTKAVVVAAGKAQKAADLILGRTSEEYEK